MSQYGKFFDFCRDSGSKWATIPVCNLFNESPRRIPSADGFGGCDLTGIPLSGDRQLANLGSIILDAFAIIITLGLMFLSEKKRAAVGRREMQYFLFGFLVISICEIFTIGGFPINGRVVRGFTAAHIATVVATAWVLLLNAIVGFQLLEDGTFMSMILVAGSSLAFFVGTGYIALDTGFSWTGFWDSTLTQPNQAYALYTLYLLAPLLFIVLFFVLEAFLVVVILGERRPLLYLAAAGLLFAIGQIFQFVASVHICNGTSGKINGGMFETMFTLASVVMIWVFWSSITEDDWPSTGPGGRQRNVEDGAGRIDDVDDAAERNGDGDGHKSGNGEDHNGRQRVVDDDVDRGGVPDGNGNDAGHISGNGEHVNNQAPRSRIGGQVGFRKKMGVEVKGRPDLKHAPRVKRTLRKSRPLSDGGNTSPRQQLQTLRSRLGKFLHAERENLRSLINPLDAYEMTMSGALRTAPTPTDSGNRDQQVPDTSKNETNTAAEEPTRPSYESNPAYMNAGPSESLHQRIGGPSGIQSNHRGPERSSQQADGLSRQCVSTGNDGADDQSSDPGPNRYSTSTIKALLRNGRIDLVPVDQSHIDNEVANGIGYHRGDIERWILRPTRTQDNAHGDDGSETGLTEIWLPRGSLEFWRSASTAQEVQEGQENRLPSPVTNEGVIDSSWGDATNATPRKGKGKQRARAEDEIDELLDAPSLPARNPARLSGGNFGQPSDSGVAFGPSFASAVQMGTIPPSATAEQRSQTMPALRSKAMQTPPSGQITHAVSPSGEGITDQDQGTSQPVATLSVASVDSAPRHSASTRRAVSEGGVLARIRTMLAGQADTPLPNPPDEEGVPPFQHTPPPAPLPSINIERVSFDARRFPRHEAGPRGNRLSVSHPDTRLSQATTAVEQDPGYQGDVEDTEEEIGIAL